MTGCRSLTISPDDSYVFVSMGLLTQAIIQFNLADLTSVKSVSLVCSDISTIYYYGSQMIFVNSISALNNYQHSVIDMSSAPGSKLWGRAFG